jgi:hypothetical protein
MKKIMGLVFILAMGLGSTLWADTQPATVEADKPLSASATASPTATPVTPDVLHLGGRLGFGTGFVPFDTNTYSFSLTTISGRLWLSDQFCLDLQGAYNGFSSAGTGFNNTSISNPNTTYALGLGGKLNIKEPMKYLFIQLLGQVSFTDNTYQQSGDTQINVIDNRTLGMFAGIGFEYFIPFLDALSVESNIGFYSDLNWVTNTTQYLPSFDRPNYVQTNNYYSNLIQVNGMTFNTLIIHFYF